MCWKWKRLIPPMGQNSGILDTVLKLLFEMHLSLSVLILLFYSLEQCSFNKQQWSLIGLMFCPRSPTSCWLSTQAPILLSTVGRWEIGLRQRGKGGSVLLTIPMGISSITHLSHKEYIEFLQHTFASRTGNSEVSSWQFWAVRKYFLFPSLLGGNQVFLEKSTRKYTVQFSSQW